MVDTQNDNSLEGGFESRIKMRGARTGVERRRMRHHAGNDSGIGFSGSARPQGTYQKAVVEKRAKGARGGGIERTRYGSRPGRGHHDLPKSFLRRDDIDFEDTDSFDFAFNLVAGLEKYRRHPCKTDARWSSRADHVARFERDPR